MEPRIGVPPSPEVSAEGVEPLLFEVSWEVCNKLGGIYQVIRSKAPTMVERWGDNYCLIGPYEGEKSALEFEPTRPEGPLGRVVNVLRDAGLHVHHGRWLSTGKPRVILIDHRRSVQELNALKHAAWEAHNISFLNSDEMCDGVLSFADAVFRVLTAVCQHASGTPEGMENTRPVIAHFHEWMGGLAIPMIRRARLPIATVFTTHATLLGRYVASQRPDFYDILETIDDRQAAADHGVTTQHLIERACAHGAHVLTTVSSITGEECEHLLGRAPEVILPNGLDLRQTSPTDLQRLHHEQKEKIHRFVMGHFFPSYNFDLDKTLYFFTSGRFEPQNKGFDLALEAMARLNAELKAAELDVNVVFFIISNRPVRSPDPDVLQARGVLNELRNVCASMTRQLEEKLFMRAAARETPSLDELVDEYWTLRLRRTQHALRHKRLPPVITHILQDPAGDPVLNQIRSLWITNREEDPVKVIYHPQFISPDNPLWGIEYEQFVRGCHLGVFPSAYEPWGYTPLECAAVGVPSISSDLAGFGRYVLENMMGHEELGLYVLERRGHTYADAAADLCRRMLEFCRMDRRERIAIRNATERQSGAFDWSRLAVHYHEAHELALKEAHLTTA
ncbi:MAG: glycogen synthase [Phycisphaeraceae bacterium]|nr:MAG: glycogen synthase [Phycisphaeraceae bacterium]